MSRLPESIRPATHTWTGHGGIKKCRFCPKQTTGKLKDVMSGKVIPFCSECAHKAGFR
jgi:hypothetical protein